MTRKSASEVKQATAIQIVEGLSTRLVAVNEDTLPVVLMEAAERNAPVVVGMVKPNVVDITATLAPFSNTLDEGDKLPSSPSYTWMVATEDSPITQNERCKDLPIVYVVFARPDVQKRPVACLSLEELRNALDELSV